MRKANQGNKNDADGKHSAGDVAANVHGVEGNTMMQLHGMLLVYLNFPTFGGRFKEENGGANG